MKANTKKIGLLMILMSCIGAPCAGPQYHQTYCDKTCQHLCTIVMIKIYTHKVRSFVMLPSRPQSMLLMRSESRTLTSNCQFIRGHMRLERGGGTYARSQCSCIGKARCHRISHSLPCAVKVYWLTTISTILLLLQDFAGYYNRSILQIYTGQKDNNAGPFL